MGKRRESGDVTKLRQKKACLTRGKTGGPDEKMGTSEQKKWPAKVAQKVDIRRKNKIDCEIRQRRYGHTQTSIIAAKKHILSDEENRREHGVNKKGRGWE
jgi:hypothetical protein